jgi:hypothetical protein
MSGGLVLACETFAGLHCRMFCKTVILGNCSTDVLNPSTIADK